MENSRLLIRNGTLVTAESVFRSDLLIAGETIAEIAPEIQDPQARIVDAARYHIFPGLVDAHVHLRDPGATHKEDFATGTRAALAGGVTTVLDMPNNPRPTTTGEAMDEKRRLLTEHAACDFALYVGGTAVNVQAAATVGAVGIKLYLGATTGDLLVTDFQTLYRHFAANRELPIVVHAEDDEALKYFATEPGRTRHSERRPPLAAALAVARALALAEVTGHPLHIAHLSTAAELALVKAAKERGVCVTCEVTPQHLFLSTDDEERLGAFGIVNPPLRSPEDVAALWAGKDVWEMVATDHAPHTLAEKQSAKPPSGMPGLETLLPLLLTAAGQGRLSLTDIARLACANPARVFHLGRKGRIAKRYDADLVFVDVAQEYVLQRPWRTKCNWSPFEGVKVRGRVERVYLRGRAVLSSAGGPIEPRAGREVTLLRGEN